MQVNAIYDKMNQATLKPEYAELRRLLEHDNFETRRGAQEFMANDPLYTPRYNVSLEMERELAFQRLKKLADRGFISVMDFERNPLNIFAAHEAAGMVDNSFSTKLTVQFNLFGGSIVKLGTDRHRYLLPKIDKLQAVGCFALTGQGCA